MSRRRLRNARPKALFGMDGAITASAIATAATANIAANIGIAASQRKTLEQNAQNQAKTITDNAKLASDTIKEQTEKYQELAQKQLDTTLKLHEEDKNQFRDMQMALQLNQGKQNNEERERASNIQLARGGRIRNKNYGAFSVTDGGKAMLNYITPEGYPIYEFYGNDHKHYHKTRSGKYESGVGVKLANGGMVEAEGNQHSSTGELLYVSPNGYDFISKHSMGGIVPADLVRAGVHPEDAFAYQESYKAAHGIADDGSRAKYGKRCKRLAGGFNTNNIYNGNNYMSIGSLGALGQPIDVAQIGTNQDEVSNGIFTGNKAKYGKRFRLKSGGRLKLNNGAGWAQAGAAGAEAIGNLIAYFIASGGNNKAAEILKNAYGEGAQYLIDAYSQMHGIDISDAIKHLGTPAYAMPALRSPRFYVGAKTGAVNRLAAAKRKAINESSISSAARLARLANVDRDLSDQLNAIYDYQANQENERAEKNADRTTETSQLNAKLASMNRRDVADLELDWAKYNNQLEVNKLLGIAGAKSAAATNSAEALALARTTNAGLLGSTIQSIGKGLSNALGSWSQYLRDRDSQYAGLQPSEKLNYLLGTDNSRWGRRRAEDIYPLLDAKGQNALTDKYGPQVKRNRSLTQPVANTPVATVPVNTPYFVPAQSMESMKNAVADVDSWKRLLNNIYRR